MTRSNWTPAMHAVLDGEADPDEIAALDATLANDAAARVEFQRLESLFDQFATLPSQQPPEGLVAAVSTALREYSRSDQPRGAAGVLGSIPQDVGLDIPSRLPAETASTFSFSFFGEQAMDQQSSNVFSNRKVLVGGAVAVAVVAVAVAFSFSSAPRNEDVNGTIVAAERYRAPQTTTEGVQLGDMSVAQLLQNDAFLRVVKDPQVQALMVEPDFQLAAQQILDNPDAVRRSLAGEPDPQAIATLRAALAHPDAARMLLSVPEANRAILHYPQASLSFVPAEMRAQFEAQNAAIANRIPAAQSASSADRVPSAQAAPNADRAPSAFAAPNADRTPSAFAAPNADRAPSALAAPNADRAPSALAAPNADRAPSALAAPNADRAPSALKTQTADRAPSALAAPNADRAPSALKTQTADRAPSALSAPNADRAPSAMKAPAADRAPSALSAPNANSAPSAMNATSANRAPAQQ